MMQRWRLPESLWRPILRHHAPEPADDCYPGAAILHLATRLVDAFERVDTLDEAAVVIDPEAWRMAAVSPEQCISLTERVEEEFRAVLQMIRPLMDAA
jgi:hypothetical protein